jgi:hypothetical protein
MFAASLSMASVVWKPDDWTLARLLKVGHHTAAVATLAYLPDSDNILQVCVSFVFVCFCWFVCVCVCVYFFKDLCNII